MVDITHKSNTLRIATAQAIVTVSKPETIDLIRSSKIPKGDVFEMSRAAGLLGVKKTPEILPDCHPLPIEYAGVEYEIDNLSIIIKMTIKTIYKTGVEVEAMHGASIIALNMYDMLKPVDKGVEISHIKLLEKKGGKSNHKPKTTGITAQVVVCSDTISKGKKEDRAGKTIRQILEGFGIENVLYTIIADEADQIKTVVERNEADLLIFTGGTGVGPRDITPDTLLPMLDARLAGVEETIRNYGQQRMPYAMLSRSVAGVINGKIVLAVPGSTNGAKEAMEAVFPSLFHVFHVLKGGRHD